MKIKTEVFSKGRINAMCEMALMGVTQCMTDRDNLEYALDYISKMLKNSGRIANPATGAEILSNFKSEPRGFVVNTLMGDMIVVTIILHDEELKRQPNLDSRGGVLCYCYNYSVDYFSELGYCFFKNEGGIYRRIS